MEMNDVEEEAGNWGALANVITYDMIACLTGHNCNV